MARKLVDLFQQYDQEHVIHIVKALDGLFGNGYAETNIDVTVALLEIKDTNPLPQAHIVQPVLPCKLQDFPTKKQIKNQ